MSISAQLRSQLERKRKQRIDAEAKVGKFRHIESTKRADATRARQAAQRSNSTSTIKSKLSEADRRDRESVTAGMEANRWQSRASSYATEERNLATRLANAEQSEANTAERNRKRAQQQADRRAANDRAKLEQRIQHAEDTASQASRQLRAPKPELLRVLLLGASADGGLRIGREQKRIRTAVESALHRDLIQLDARAAATANDLLDGITKFRPHVVHFSGHSNEDLILLEEERDELHEGTAVTAQAFEAALGATDDPPLLVLLNSCNTVGQATAIAARNIIPFAIGMAYEIDDGDAINYAARFYASVANGQSIQSAHEAGKAQLALAGLAGAELPTLVAADNVDPASTILVQPQPQ